MSVAAIVSQLQALTCKAESLAEKFRQTCPTDDRYRTVEDLSLRLTKAANMFPAVVKELSEARKEEVRKESHKLSSEAQATRNDLIANCRLINPATFRRNIILTFEGPKNSTFDSRGIKSRKESTRKRCEQIRGLNYDGVVSWALAYPPTQWAAGFMAADIFNSLIETIEPEEEEEWPLEVRDMLRALGAEPPLQESTNYHQFLRGLSDIIREHEVELMGG